MEALGHYLVELHRPPGGWDGLQRLAAQARGTAEQLTAEGTPVRFLRSIFVPDEDSCFLLYAAASADAVGEAGRRAALAVERIDTAVGVDRAPTHQGFAKLFTRRKSDDRDGPTRGSTAVKSDETH